MVASLCRFAGGLLVLALSVAAALPRVAESIRHPTSYGPKNIGKISNSSWEEGETRRGSYPATTSIRASVRLRSLQVSKNDSTPVASPVASGTGGVSKGPGGVGVDKGPAPGSVPSATPISLAPAGASPTTASFAPVIRFDSSWQFPPSLSPTDAVVATGGVDAPFSPYIPTAAPTAAGDGATTGTGGTITITSWTFTMTTNPPVVGGLLLMQLEQYLPGSTVVYNTTANGVFTVTSPEELVDSHQMAMLNKEALQRHFQQTLGGTFTIDKVLIQAYDNSTVDNNNNSNKDYGPTVAPTTETVVERKYTKKDIVLLIAFGISMTMIIGGITALYCWKREIGETELAGSREWAYDKDKEEQLGVVETLSSSAAAEGFPLAIGDEQEPNNK